MGALLALASVLAACGVTDDGYTYVENQEERAFFKLPDEWGKFQVKEEISADRPTPISRGVPWKIVFDGAAKPKQSNFDLSFPKKPVGTAEVINLSQQGQEQINEAMVRSWLLDEYGEGESLDPVDLWRNGNQNVELVDYSRFANKGGVWGSKIIVSVRIGTGEGDKTDWITLAQKAYVDRASSKVFRLVIKCSSTCYKTERRQLDQVLNSLQLKP